MLHVLSATAKAAHGRLLLIISVAAFLDGFLNLVFVRCPLSLPLQPAVKHAAVNAGINTLDYSMSFLNLPDVRW